MSIHIVSGGRQTGRTTAMIRTAAASFAYIVCPDRRQVEHIQRMAQEMGVDIPQPITWDDFIKGRYHRPGVRGFVIDNLDDCIQRTTRVPVLAASVGPVDRIRIPLPEDGS